MATKLMRPVTRETADVDPCHGRTLMVKLETGGKFVRIWKKGCRKVYNVSYQAIWRLGLNAEMDAIRRERRKR